MSPTILYIPEHKDLWQHWAVGGEFWPRLDGWAALWWVEDTDHAYFEGEDDDW